jgi:hypothetical protein
MINDLSGVPLPQKSNTATQTDTAALGPITITTGANMDQIQFDGATASPVKKQAERSDIDGNIHRRDRRVEIRFRNEERGQLAHLIYQICPLSS